MKRFGIGTLSHWYIGTLFIGILAHCAISTLFLSCTGDIVQPEQPGSETTGRTVRREVTLQTAPMQGTQGKDATRATTPVPLSTDEKKIHSLWVLQFGGTDAGSLLIKKGEVPVGDINPETGAFYFDFEELAAGGQIKVYVLVNVAASALNGLTVNVTTLADFEASNLSVSPLTAETMKTSGLPMVGAQSFDYANSNPAAFAMKSLLAKVVFQYSTGDGFTFANVNLSVHNLASAVPVKELAAGAAVQHPAGISYAGSLTLVDDGTYNGTETVCYLPENLSGQVAAIVNARDRGGKNVPQEAAFIKVRENMLNDKSYSFYVGDGTPQDFNLQRHCRYTLNMKLKGMHTTDKRVVIRSANCYIVTKVSTTYSFEATVRGNGDESVPGIDYASLPDLTTATEARVIWEQGSGKGKVISAVSLDKATGKVSFTTGPDTEGNAVIGLFASSDVDAPCLWSWHIWKLNGSAPGEVTYTKTPSPATASTVVHMMDRNLGAYNNIQADGDSYGLLYQWGRKDPFPGIGTSGYGERTNIFGNYTAGYGTSGSWRGTYSIQTIIPDMSSGAEDWAVKYPAIFIAGRDDWMMITNDNLWGTPWIASGSVDGYNGNQGTKSIYDPCPMGYRVLPQDTWSKLTVNSAEWGQRGTIMTDGTKSIFFSSGEYRDKEDGVLSNSPSEGSGYYWSSSPYNTSGHTTLGGYFSCYDLSIWSQGNERSYGMSVRCVAE